jgi:hypothetical protein
MVDHRRPPHQIRNAGNHRVGAVRGELIGLSRLVPTDIVRALAFAIVKGRDL